MSPNPLQISQLGSSEKTTPDNTDLFPFQQADGVCGRISRANLVKGLATSSAQSSSLLSTSTIFLAHLDSDISGITDIKGNTLNSIGSPILSATQNKLGEKSLYLPGSSYITSPASPKWRMNCDFYIEFFAWLPSTYSSNDKYVDFISIAQGTTTSIAVGKWRSGNRPHWYGDITTPQGSFTLDTSVAPTLNTWHHVAFIRQGMTLYLFIDGELSNSLNMTFCPIFSGDFTLSIGSSIYGATAGGTLAPIIGGYMSEVRIRKAIASVPTLPYEL